MDRKSPSYKSVFAVNRDAPLTGMSDDLLSGRIVASITLRGAAAGAWFACLFRFDAGFDLWKYLYQSL